MKKRCETAAVLGAGVMGTGIAAHLAGAGIKTLLLDRVPDNLSETEAKNPAARSKLATEAIGKALKGKPQAFFDPEAARLVVPGNFEDHFDKLKGCDLIIEVIVERLDAKQALLKRLAPVVKPDVVLASNTSGLSIASMTEALPDALKSRFLVMHFFNPVRYMHLLELVAGDKTDPAVVKWTADLGERLGKGVVYGKDTPNFVANRIGVYAMMQAIHGMEKFGLNIEEVDKICGKPMGRPASACFRTGDLVGIDTLLHVAHSCDSLQSDSQRDTFKIPTWISELVKSGRTGQKVGQGFYKKVGDEIQVLDVASGAYRAQNKVRFDSLGKVKDIKDVAERLRTLVASDDNAAKFAWHCIAGALSYSAARVGEIADDIVNIDRAMRWGFNWDLGPFEVWDALGVQATAARMKKDGFEVPSFVDAMLKSGQKSFYAGTLAAPTYFCAIDKKVKAQVVDSSAINLAAIHQAPKGVIKENKSASILDLGDGCMGFEVHTTMNTLDLDVLDMLDAALTEAEEKFEALVIGNDSAHFGAGFNVNLIYMAAQQKAWSQVDNISKRFQDVCQRLRYAQVPVVVAPYNYTFGGAAEMAMAADACQAHAETYMGLVEVGVGIVPAGGGCLRMLERYTDGIWGIDGAELLTFVGPASLQIATAKVSASAEDARRLRMLRTTDGISLSRDRLLHDAKHRALGLARAGYRPPAPRVLKAAGLDAAKTIGMRIWSMVESGFATPYDAVIANKVAYILCGGAASAGSDITEQAVLDLEREALLSLCGEDKTQARMQSMLTQNKPLRN